MPSPEKLGIIAGGGHLPLKLAEACEAQDRAFFILAIEGAAELAALTHLPHASVRIGAVGEALEQLRKNAVRELVMAGAVKRPSMSSLMPDALGLKLMGTLGLKLFAGDDALLKALVAFFESEGFKVVGADDVLSDLLALEGCLSEKQPDAQAKKDIALGLRVAKAIGALDVGQAAVVENEYVLGVEAAEGTDALIARCALLCREKGRAVLVKAAKPDQESRADLPAIGPQTIERLHAAGFAGVAVEAGATLLLDREEIIAFANRLGIFVAGVKA